MARISGQEISGSPKQGIIVSIHASHTERDEIVREVAYNYNLNGMEDSEIEKDVFDWIDANING